MNQRFLDYYRCPDSYGVFAAPEQTPGDEGYFQFGDGIVCYGKSWSGISPSPTGSDQYDALPHATTTSNRRVNLTFDPSQVIDNLRLERYAFSKDGRSLKKSLARSLYYSLRPLLPVSVRKHLQRLYLRDWSNRPFPAWPVDRTVEGFMQQLVALSMKALNAPAVPFIWFWPEGRRSCAIVTHDVETSSGRDFCPHLMDIDDAFGIKSSFQLIPENRYQLLPSLLDQIRGRGFEINIHDLNHDGRLYSNRPDFLTRAQKINSYAREYGAAGFRSAILYRNLEWYDAYSFSYDMSVPNVAHLDPQRGGCSTVMPYFIGNILELPLTTTQDYSLFHVIDQYSIDLWKLQMELIMDSHGLMSFNIHPDYVIEQRARSVYRSLLEHLSRLHSDADIWLALPGEVDRWWRDRAQMKLFREGSRWQIAGRGSEKARLAYATLEDGQVRYFVDKPPLYSRHKSAPVSSPI